ncbi:MAG: class I SAM-dependent methyltransferase [Methylococcaceae bacterium]
MKARISNLLRQLGILYYTDKIRFYVHYIKKIKESRNFKKENPQVKLPPSYLIYESFNLNYYKYYFDSKASATWLLDHLKKHIELKNLNILDWGCGPARIVRHLPELLDGSCSIYATDYNPKTIAWNRKALTGINFNLNDAHPPLPYVDNSFDIVYGLSIFTHLSEDLHYEWFNELSRITKKGGIIFLTLQGDIYKAKLTSSEQELFDAGNLIIKGNTKIGHRTFSAFHPMPFVKRLIGDHQVLEHVKGEIKNGMYQQDVWIIKVIK